MTFAGWAAVEQIRERYGIESVNFVKPGVGEATRVLLRRVPWKILVREPDHPDHEHLRLLAAAPRRAGRGGARPGLLLRGPGPPVSPPTPGGLTRDDDTWSPPIWTAR